MGKKERHDDVSNSLTRYLLRFKGIRVTNSVLSSRYGSTLFMMITFSHLKMCQYSVT